MIETPIKWLGLILAGLALVYSAFSGVGLDAPERTGVLFQRFGASGVFWSYLGLAGLSVLIGGWGLARWFRRLRRDLATRHGAAGPPRRSVVAMRVAIALCTLILLAGIGFLLIRLAGLVDIVS